MNRAFSYESSLECIWNSRQFLDDARILIRRKSFGHAFAFLVLAEEELGKAYLRILETIGVEIPRKLLMHDHVAKQILSMTIFDEANLSLFAHVGRILSIATERDSRKERQARIERADRRFVKKWNRDFAGEKGRKSAEAAFERLFELENRKWAGLYVDIDTGHEWASLPRKFSRAEAHHALKRVGRIHDRLGTTFDITKRLTSNQIDAWTEMVQPQIAPILQNLQAMVDNLETAARFVKNRPSYGHRPGSSSTARKGPVSGIPPKKRS